MIPELMTELMTELKIVKATELKVGDFFYEVVDGLAEVTELVQEKHAIEISYQTQNGKKGMTKLYNYQRVQLKS